jgi:hypothetical protein
MPRRLTKLSETIFIGSMVGAMAVATMAGCGAESQVPPPNDANNMRGILRYYSMAAVGLGRPPTKMEELEATLIGAVDDPTPFFRSTRGRPAHGDAVERGAATRVRGRVCKDQVSEELQAERQLSSVALSAK